MMNDESTRAFHQGHFKGRGKKCKKKQKDEKNGKKMSQKCLKKSLVFFTHMKHLHVNF